MNVNELAVAAQSLSFEQRKELIKTLFAQQPKPHPQSATITWVGDLEVGSQEIREQINTSLERSAHELNGDNAKPPQLSPLTQMMLSHAGTVDDWPADFALNHDHYLYGADKRADEQV